jgi:hypothetical protein
MGCVFGLKLPRHGKLWLGKLIINLPPSLAEDLLDKEVWWSIKLEGEKLGSDERRAADIYT